MIGPWRVRAGLRTPEVLLLLAAVLVVGQAVTSRSVLGFLPAAVWLLPMWLVWVCLGTLSVLRPKGLAVAGFLLSCVHGLQHLGHAGRLATEQAHYAVEGLLTLCLVVLPWQYRADVRRVALHALTSYLREPLPPLPVIPAPRRNELWERANRIAA